MAFNVLLLTFCYTLKSAACQSYTVLLIAEQTSTFIMVELENN